MEIGEFYIFDKISQKGGILSTFHNLLLKDLKTKIKIGTNNLLHVEYTFYDMFKLDTKNPLIGTTFTCMFFLLKHDNL
jgi:hypothetical protein